MANMFTLDLSELKKLKKWAKRNPPQFKRAYAMTLNSLAWAIKKEIPNQLDKTMEIRNPRFVNSKIRVQNAKYSGQISDQQAIVGSIYGPRFSGWREQITGEASQKDRIATNQARKGEKSLGILLARARMNRKEQFHKQQDFAHPQWGKTRAQRTTAMMAAIRKRKVKNKPFILSGNISGRLGNTKYGIYEFAGAKGRLKVLQYLHRKPKTKKNNWAINSINAVHSRFNLKNEWARNINKVLRK